MKFTQTGTFKKNTLEKRETINPKESVQNIFFDRLDCFLGFAAKEKSEIVLDYVNNLIKKYQGLVEEDYLKNASDDVGKTYSDFENLHQYPELTRASLNYFIELLQLEEKNAWEMTEVEISMKALVQAWTYPSYYFLQALTETIDRKEAVKLFKR